MELLLFAILLNRNHGFLIPTAGDSKGPQFDVFLYRGIVDLSTYEPFGIKNGVFGVSSGLILGCVPNFSSFFGKGHIGWRSPVSHLIFDDLNLTVLHD